MSQSKNISGHMHAPLLETVGFIWSLISDRKGLLFGLLGCTLVCVAIEIFIPVLGKVLFNHIELADITNPDDTADVLRLTLQFFALIAGFWVFRYVMFFVWIPFGAQYMRKLMQGAFDHVQSFSSTWHNDSFAGVTVRNITRGVGAVDGVVSLMVEQFLPSLLLVLGTAVWLMVTGYVGAGLVFLGFFAVFMGTTGTISLRVVAPRNQRANLADSEVGGQVADAISCNAAVKAFGTEELESQNLANVLDKWVVYKSAAWRAGLLNGVLQTTFIIGLRCGFVSFAVWEWTQARMGLGDVFYFFSMTAIIQAYLRDFGMNLRMLQNHINDVDPVAAYMKLEPSVSDVPDAPELQVMQGRIELLNVRFGYKGKALFDDLNLQINAGETVALVGRSGSGKSSFVKLVQRLYDVDGGEIFIDDQNIARVQQASLRRAIALVPQDPVLFHRTLHENIAYGRPEATLDEVRMAAKDAYIDEFIHALPEGYDTKVGERGVKLSGGERQRVAIARALLANRPILIMDEATSALDSVSETLIQKALEKLMAGRTTLVIAHRLSTIRQADRILVFEDGRIVEQGTHQSLLEAGGQYKALYDAQVDGLI